MSAAEKRAELAERAAALGIVGRCSYCGELWPLCKCGRPIRPTTPLVEWVQWRSKRGELSRYHVRLSSGGWLLCGRRVPEGSAPAADSFASSNLCRVCASKLGRVP